jgi:hypothetical protein
LVEVLLIDWDAAGIELGDPISVDVRANHFVPCLSKTSSRDQTYVPTSDD